MIPVASAERTIAQPWLAVLVVLATTLLATAFHYTLTSRDRLDDDDLVFYYNALSLDYPARFDALNAQVSGYLSHAPLDPNCNCLWDKYRFDLREQFRNHYPLYHLAIAGVRDLLQPFTRQAGIDYATAIGTTMVVTYYISFLAIIAFIWLAIFGFVRSELVVAFALAVAAMLLIDEISPYRARFWELRVRPSGLEGGLEWLRSAISMFVSPSTTIVEWFPRPLSMLMTMAVFLLRWSGRPGTSYAVVAGVIVVHQGTGSLVLFTLLAIDALLYADRFRHIASLLAIALACAAVLLPNGLLAEGTGVSWSIIPLAIIGIAAIVIVAALLERSSSAPLAALQHRRTALMKLGQIPADLAALAVLWFAWSILSLAMYLHIGKPNAVYTWGDLPARYLMTFRGPAFLGLFTMAVSRLADRMGGNVTAFGAVAACAAVLLLRPVPADSAHALARLARSLAPLEQELRAAQDGLRQQRYDEALTYYAIAKSIETDADLVRPLIREVRSRR
jgi:hypothetical protein